jgi:hypothetical protein
MGTLDIYLLEGLDWCLQSPPHARPATRLPDIPSWSWASPNQAISFGTLLHARRLTRSASKLSLDKWHVRVRACFQVLEIKRTDLPYDSDPDRGPQELCSQSYTCERPKSPLNGMVDSTTPWSHTGKIVWDTLQDGFHQEGETILCILWKVGFMFAWSTPYTIAIIVMPVEGQDSTYRRRGRLEFQADGRFQDESRDIVLV